MTDAIGIGLHKKGVVGLCLNLQQTIPDIDVNTYPKEYISDI